MKLRAKRRSEGGGLARVVDRERARMEDFVAPCHIHLALSVNVSMTNCEEGM